MWTDLYSLFWPVAKYLMDMSNIIDGYIQPPAKQAQIEAITENTRVQHNKVQSNLAKGRITARLYSPSCSLEAMIWL